MSIRAIIFDYGLVISLPQDQKAMEYIARKIGVEKEKFETILWSLRKDYDRGTISGREYYNRILSSLGVSLDNETIDEFIEVDFLSWKNVNPETVALMEDVKKAGYILGILSNMPHNFLAWARKNIPVFSLPHISLFSCEVNLIKPEKAIYEKIISMAGVKPEELVFFDDNRENVESAVSMGIKAFLWKDPGNARRELSSMGVRL